MSQHQATCKRPTARKLPNYNYSNEWAMKKAFLNLPEQHQHSRLLGRCKALEPATRLLPESSKWIPTSYVALSR